MVYQSKQSLEAEARRQQEIEAGLISDRFPQVRKIRLEVEFHDSTGARVQRRCRDLLPESYALFDMKCPLDSTPFDLHPVVAKMISGRTKKQAGQVQCQGSQSDTDHSVSYQIEIDFRSKAR